MATALGDASGLHLGAGPYLLFYSREEGTWPEELPASDHSPVARSVRPVPSPLALLRDADRSLSLD